jgi:hypothetical protein
MTPKEKAGELVNKFLQYTPVEFEYEYAKKCALIAVEYLWDESEYGDGYYQRSLYWQEVKQEINNL